MNLIGTIFLKEVRTYLRSPWFFLIMGITCSIASWLFLIQAGLYQVMSQGSMQNGQPMQTFHQAVLANYVGTLHFCLFLFLPALTARLVAEEKKLKSFDLLMTAPITSTQIVVAKMLAGIWVLAFTLGLTALYPLYLSLFASMEWGLFFSTYGAMFLVGGCYVAIGVFTSSISDSMIIATILAIALNFGLWLVALLGQNTDDALVQLIVNHISVNFHFGNLMRGRVEVAGLVYMLSVISFFGFLAQRAVESMRWR